MAEVMAAVAAKWLAMAVLGEAGKAAWRIVGGRVESALADRKQHAAFTRACQRAFTQFEAEHQDVAGGFYHRKFIDGAVAPLLREFFQRRGQLPDAGRLVDYWAKLYKLPAPPGLVEAAADDYVKLLTTELKAERVLDGLFDSAAWDSMAESGQTSIMLQQIDNLDLLVSAARRLGRAARRIQRDEPDAQDLASEARDLSRRAFARMKVACTGNLGQLARVKGIRSRFLEVLDLYDVFLDHPETVKELQNSIEAFAETIYSDFVGR